MLHLEYRAPGGGAWRASNDVSKDFNRRKAHASIERIIEALVVGTPTTEWDEHSSLLPLFRPRYRTYESRTTGPRIEEKKAELGEDGQALLQTTFGQLVDSLKMTGDARCWQLQEEGKIPVFGAFAFHMRLLGIHISPGGCLPEGALEKRTCEGDVVDPVERALPLQPSKKTNRRRYLVIWKTDVCRIGMMNAREWHGEDALEKVVKSWREFEHLDSWRPLAIFDGSGRDAHAFALETTRERFEAARCVGGPARTLAQLEEFLSARPVWEQPVGMPTATASDFLEVFLGSMVVCPHGRRVTSYNLYVNLAEEIIEMHHGGKPKLCKLFSKMSERARELGEAVVGVKPGNSLGDTVVVFPCGIEMTLAMRSPYKTANWHDIKTSGEASASVWIFGESWQAFYRMFNETGGAGVPLSECPFFSLVPCHHERLARTRRIEVPMRFKARELPILSVEKFDERNWCLTNETQVTVSDLFGRRGETRAQVLEALGRALVSLRGELSAIRSALPRLREREKFPKDAALFDSLDALIAGCGAEDDRSVRRRTQ